MFISYDRLCVCLFVSGTTTPPSPQWARASSFTRFLDHTRHTTVGRTPLDEWLARRRDPLPDNTQHSQQTNIQALGGIGTHNLSRRATADPRLRPRGRWKHSVSAKRGQMMQCNALLQMLLVFIRSYAKSVLRYKFLILYTYHHPYTQCLRQQGCEGPCLFVENKNGPAIKNVWEALVCAIVLNWYRLTTYRCLVWETGTRLPS